MKCPHCLAELKYKERQYRRCPNCQRPFALEPRTNALNMSDLRLRGIAERLSELRIPGIDVPVSEQRYRYTSLQLGYAVLRKKEAPKSSLGRKMYAAKQAIARYLPLKSPLESFLPILTIFEEQFIWPWERIHGILPGRVTADEIAALRLFQLPPQQVRAVLASPVPDILDCLRANDLPKKLGLALINPDRLTRDDEAIIALLRSRPRLPLLLIHDAGVTECLLPVLLPERWGLASNHRVIDLGLRPRHAQQLQLPWERKAPPKELLALLERHAQMPGGLALTPEEREWLRQGYIVPALFIPPARLVTTVTQAVERLAPKPVVDPEVKAKAQARAVGFMTWPS